MSEKTTRSQNEQDTSSLANDDNTSLKCRTYKELLQLNNKMMKFTVFTVVVFTKPTGRWETGTTELKP